MIKHVFTDLDCSFFGKDCIVPKENFDSINKLKEKGIGFSIQTGRLICSVESVLNDIGINNKDDEFFISGNGAIIANTNKKILYERPISKKNLLIILDYLYSFERQSFYVVSKDTYNITYLPKDKIVIKTYTVVSKEDMYEIIDKENIYKVLVYDEDADLLKHIESKIIEITNGDMLCSYSSTTHLEVNSAGTNKGEGLRKFCELKGIDIKDTLAIGDNYNDVTMLEAAGHTGCPSNAADDIKAIVDYVSPLDCDQGAFADIVNHFVFKED